MQKELYMKVLGAVDIYIYSVPRTGLKGMLAKEEYKACNLFKFYFQLAVAVEEEDDNGYGDTLINYFLASIISADLLQKINALNDVHVPISDLQKEVRAMNKGSVKLKSSIRSIYLKQIDRHSPIFESEGAVARSRTPSPATTPSLTFAHFIDALPYESLFSQSLPDDLMLDVTNLTKIKEIRESAHRVVIYEDEPAQQLYFGKLITSPRQLDEYATEIIYSSIWRYFLGERVSASLIMVDQNKSVRGICSKGLRGFVEHSKLPQLDENSYDVFGLISIIIFAFILMEDDLHIKNLGLATVNGDSVYGKIDHDFICSRWQENEQSHALEQKFPIEKIKHVIKSKQAYTMKDIMGAFRFAPGKENSSLLRLAHHLRPQGATTVGPAKAKNFDLYDLPNAQEEFLATIDLIKNTDYDEFEYRIKKIIAALARKNFPVARALSLFTSINMRLRSLQ